MSDNRNFVEGSTQKVQCLQKSQVLINLSNCTGFLLYVFTLNNNVRTVKFK